MECPRVALLEILMILREAEKQEIQLIKINNLVKK